MPAIVKDDPWWVDPKDPHRVAYTNQGLIGPTLPYFWVFNPAYAQVQNEHVWQTAWAEIMKDRGGAAGGGGEGLQAGRGDLFKISDRARLRGRRAMTTMSRRPVLRASLAAAAAGTLVRPNLANAAATTATVWWVQGFAEEEDISFKKIVADYEKASGNTIDYSIIPYAPERQKIVSAVTSGVVPDLFQNNPAEIIALYAWEDKLVDVTDVVETQKSLYNETALLTAHCYNSAEEEAQLLRRALYRCGATEPYLATASRESWLHDGGPAENLGCLLRFLQGRNCAPRASERSMVSVSR
jgi:hypothetical protein